MSSLGYIMCRAMTDPLLLLYFSSIGVWLLSKPRFFLAVFFLFQVYVVVLPVWCPDIIAVKWIFFLSLAAAAAAAAAPPPTRKHWISVWCPGIIAVKRIVFLSF